MPESDTRSLQTPEAKMPADYYVLRSDSQEYLVCLRFGRLRWGSLEETIAPDTSVHLKIFPEFQKAQIFLGNNQELCHPDTTSICRVVIGSDSVSYEAYTP